jgi:alpha-ketoglutarate-dependent 2,4-dichlorophenoxyacetate dioxygenase
MHHGTEFDDLRWKRDLQRATVCDIANSCDQEGLAPAAPNLVEAGRIRRL